MDAVLGLSVTPSAVGLVLVEGQDADGTGVDREAVEIPRRRRSTAAEMSEEAAAAVLRTEAMAAARGQRLHSIGVTWSDDADVEASLLLKTLTDCGLYNVVPVRLPEATEALAWGVAEVIGHDVTAVCVVEPEAVLALIVHTREGAVQTAVNRTIDSEDALVRWLNAVFTRADWRPQALVLVGSGGDVDVLMPRLEDVLAVPVFAPADTELALARGAALASAQSDDLSFADDGMPVHRAGPSRPSRRRAGQAGPLAMLMAGAVTFVVSVSVAISSEITPAKDTAPLDPRPAAKSSPGVAAAADSVPLAAPRTAAGPPVEDVALAPVRLAPPPIEASPPEAPVELAPPPIEAPAEPPLGVVDPAVDPAAAPVDGPPVEAAPGPPVEAPPPPPPAVEPVPAEPRTLRQRIKDRLSGANRADDAAAVPPAPEVMPPDAAAPPPADAPPDAAAVPTTEFPPPPPPA